MIIKKLLFNKIVTMVNHPLLLRRATLRIPIPIYRRRNQTRPTTATTGSVSPTWISKQISFTHLSLPKFRLGLSLNSVVSICLLVVHSVISGAGMGKFHRWLSGTGAIATVDSMGRVAVITEVCVVVGTWLSDACRREGLTAVRAAKRCWARLCKT
jgi:hypothetical protein